MQDSRVIGTWKSDAIRTALEIAARRDIAAPTKVRNLFGKLELRYTQTHCHARFGGETWISRYRVIGKDATSAAILTSSPTFGPRIFHIHFEGDHYWICLGRIREFFKRIKH